MHIVLLLDLVTSKMILTRQRNEDDNKLIGPETKEGHFKIDILKLMNTFGNLGM